MTLEVPAGGGLLRSGACDCLKEYGAGDNFFTPTKENYATPKLVESWTVSSDLKKLTMKLKPGIQFQKGFGEMTAEDAAWSINDANAGTTPSSIHGQAGDFSALFGKNPWKALDKYTVEAIFENYDVTWNSNFLNDAGQGVVVVSKKAYDTKGEDWMRENVVATGPYEVKQWLRNDKITLEATPSHFWNTAKVKNVRIIQVPELSTRVAMLRTGEADGGRIDLKVVPGLVKQGFKTVSLGLAGHNIISISFTGNLWEKKHAVTGEPLDTAAVFMRDLPWVSPPDNADKMEKARKVRTALALAIDREAINKAIFEGLGAPAYMPFADPALPEWQDRWRIPYDPKKAEQLLDEAGYPKKGGVRFEVPLYAASYTMSSGEIGDAIAGMWGAIGVQAQVLKFNYAVYRPGAVARATTIPWLATFDEGGTERPFDWPDGLQMSSLSRGGASAAIESPYIAERLLKVMKEPDKEKRIKMNTEIADYQAQWMLIPGVVSFPSTFVYNPKAIKSWEMHATQVPDFNSPDRIVPAR
ncbi:MAG: ABC transporter substrate-binding protein [Chloroflexota bacterium]|nr:ABC transporter substrate-binding protein [Chloroflexota bacterium]